MIIVNRLKRIFVMMLILLISSSFVFAEEEVLEKKEAAVIDGWYAVADWEIEACSYWGGTDTAEHGAIVSDDFVSLALTTLSLQGEANKFETENFTSVLYKVSYYFQPVAGEYDYEIALLEGSEDTDGYEIDIGTASYETPAVGYFSEYINGTYEYVGLFYGDDWVLVPLVYAESGIEVEEEGELLEKVVSAAAVLDIAGKPNIAPFIIALAIIATLAITATIKKRRPPYKKYFGGYKIGP